MGTDFEDFMLRNFDLGKDGSGWSVQDLFEIAMDEAEQTITGHSSLCKTNTAKLEMLHLKPIRSEILKEMNKLSHEIQPEIYAKIELLVQAAFIAGSDTETYGSSHLVRALKQEQKSLWLGSHKAGKKEKRNPVLVQAIKEITEQVPDASFIEVKKKIKNRAKNGLCIDGYDILFYGKGKTYNGEKLKTDSLVFDPLRDTKPKLSKISMESLRRYFDNIKKGKW